MKEKICPACGAVVESVEARFCPLCGILLPVEPAKWSTGELEEKLKTRYRVYNDWAVEYRKKESGGRRLLSLISSSSPFKNSEEHGKFFDDVKAISVELLEGYRAAPGTGDLPALLNFVLIGCHDFACTEADWMFLAAEQLYLPFLDQLSGETAAALLPGYQRLRRKQSGFDFQKKILQKLKTIGDK